MSTEEFQLNGEQREFVSNTFRMYDTDRDNKVLGSFIEPILNALGQFPSKEDIKRYCSQRIPSEITLEDFMEVYRKRMAELDTEESLVQAFSVFDRSNTGRVKVEDIIKTVTQLGHEPLTKEQAQDLVNAGHPKNGYIDYRKLAKLLLASDLNE